MKENEENVFNIQFVDIQNPTARKIHTLLNDEEHFLYEIKKDAVNVGAGWAGWISQPLPKDTFRAHIDGMGIVQVINGKIALSLNVDEFLFSKKIGI